MSSIKTHKLNINFKQESFGDFLSKIDELSKIGDTIKLKIDEDEILMYSTIGETQILAFKSFLVKRNTYLDIKDSLDDPLDIVISGSKKFVKSLSFINQKHPIKSQFSWREKESGVNSVRFFDIKNDKFKLTISCGEDNEIKDIDKSSLEQRLNIKNRKWGFNINGEDFENIKKLSSINLDTRTINLDVDSDGRVTMSEPSSWELEVDNIESRNKSVIFNKSLLSNVKNSEILEFHVFESFILNKGSHSNLMISFETSFDD